MNSWPSCLQSCLSCAPLNCSTTPLSAPPQRGQFGICSDALTSMVGKLRLIACQKRRLSILPCGLPAGNTPGHVAICKRQTSPADVFPSQPIVHAEIELDIDGSSGSYWMICQSCRSITAMNCRPHPVRRMPPGAVRPKPLSLREARLISNEEGRIKAKAWRRADRRPAFARPLPAALFFPVIAPAEVFLQPDIKADKQIPAAHLLYFDLGAPVRRLRQVIGSTVQL